MSRETFTISTNDVRDESNRNLEVSTISRSVIVSDEMRKKDEAKQARIVNFRLDSVLPYVNRVKNYGDT